MDQFLVLHFNIQKNERNYQLMIQPGAPFEDIYAVLDELKDSFKKIQEEQLEKERVAKEEAEKEAVPVEAELV